MIVRLHCDLPLLNLVSDKEIQLCVGRKVIFFGCPGLVTTAHASEDETEIFFSIYVDNIYEPYLTMHSLFLNEKGDTNAPPLKFIE